jgi:hypothetical protein
MKRITILGDSNGCGEWIMNPLNNNETLTENIFFRELISGREHRIIESHPGLEFYLNEMGNACFNLSAGGNNNMKLLTDLEHSLLLRLPRHKPRFINPDYIVWILTEPLRDIVLVDDIIYQDNYPKYYKDLISIMRKNRNDIKELNLALLDYSFQVADKIYDITKIPFIIVEGLSVTYDLEKNYKFCHSKIDNWIGNIVGLTPPITATNQVFHLSQDFLEKNLKINQIDYIMEKYSEWVGVLNEHPDFPDKIHPSREKHKELAIKINEIINI